MGVLHISISAERPERVANFLSTVMGGQAFPFPPFPDSWIAFTEVDDGSAIEVYPLTHALLPGQHQIDCRVGAQVSGPTFVHAAIKSSMEASQIVRVASDEGWLARTCHRGPFDCVEVWLENRLLVEVLDPQMSQDYRRGMTMENWRKMFGLD